MSQDKDYLELGKIVGVWGVKGWIKLHSFTRQRIGIAEYNTWHLRPSRGGEAFQAYNVLACREQGQGVVAQLESIADRNQAEALSGFKIFIAKSDLPDLPQGEFYWHQLIGLTVMNESGVIATVKRILETGANDVLVCKNAVENGAEILIPYTSETVLDINTEKGEMLVDWDPAYLLD